MKADVVVVGGGVNGLVTAALLAKGGLEVLLLERRERVGGAAVTEEFAPGFKASTVAHTAGPFRASVARDLGLTGVETVSPEPRVVALSAEGRALALYGDAERSAAEIRPFSSKDAERYPAFQRSLAGISALLARVLEATPPDLDAPGVRDLWSLLGVGLGFRSLGRDDGQRLLRWGPMAVADFAAEWFESEPLRALVCARGIRGAFAGPWSAGTTANLLLQTAAGDSYGSGSTVLVKGGLGALTEAVAAAARRFGAEIRTHAEVARITVKNGVAAGVVLAGGEEIEAKAVASGADPKRTYLSLLDPAVLDPEDLQRFRNYRQVGMASKVHLALDGLPAFKALQGRDPSLATGRIQVGPTVDDLERAFDDAKYGGISRRPYLDLTIPTLTDPSLAPAGKHVMSVYVQYTPYTLREGDWESRRDEVGDVVLRTLEEHAPGIGARVLHRHVLTPADLERVYGLTGGHPFHGEPSLNQLYVTRPLLGWSRYRGPVKGLYLCGAGAHPGGGVTGGPGQNAAREILRDLR